MFAAMGGVVFESVMQRSARYWLPGPMCCTTQAAQRSIRSGGQQVNDRRFG